MSPNSLSGCNSDAKSFFKNVILKFVLNCQWAIIVEVPAPAPYNKQIIKMICAFWVSNHRSKRETTELV
jgi:hypothetical protein